MCHDFVLDLKHNTLYSYFKINGPFYFRRKIFALKRTAEDNKGDFNLQTIETVERNFYNNYVDDCLKSVKNEVEAINLAKQLRTLLARGGFDLTKWISNSRKVLESLPHSERAAQVKSMDFDKLPIERALGVQWDVHSDRFGFKNSN